MRHVEIALPADAGDSQVLRAIDRAIAQARLNVTLRGTLKKFEGCTHWHAKLGGERGTLEVTYWPRSKRAWFTIQNGRGAPWIEGGLEAVARGIQELLRDA